MWGIKEIRNKREWPNEISLAITDAGTLLGMIIMI
jgi:hypothetical protein